MFTALLLCNCLDLFILYGEDNLERRRLIQPRKRNETIENKVLFQDFNRTIATVLFEENTYPWEILPKIHDFIMEVGMLLPKDEYDEIKEHVWVAKTATVAPTAYINGPAIIGPEAEVRHCAFIRGQCYRRRRGSCR